MNLDDDLCYCYHVSMRKLINFSKRTRPDRPSLMTQCLNAGTGCGWCIPFLVKIATDPDSFAVQWTADQYAEQRQAYRTSHRPKNTFGAEGE